MAAAKYSSVLIAPGIRERNDDSCKGFIVRYFRWKARFARSFPIADFPNREAALEAAKAYYKELVEAFPPMTRKEYAEVVRRKNSSGTQPGVVGREYKVKGHPYACWRAQWSPEPGKRKVVTFNFGIERTEEEAKQLAIDLILVCPNCHMVIHSGEPDEMVHRLRIIFGRPDRFKKRSSRNN
jgi:hypothetical protein